MVGGRSIGILCCLMDLTNLVNKMYWICQIHATTNRVHIIEGGNLSAVVKDADYCPGFEAVEVYSAKTRLCASI